MAGGFQGWTEHFQRFFLGLEADNSKRYFDAHKALYRERVREPLADLLADLEPEFGPGKIFRPNRDIRFSADKSPYKTNIAADTHLGYVSLDARGLTAGGGRYHLEPAQLPRFREAVAGPPGVELQEIVDGLSEGGYEIGGEDLKRVPPPYPQDHPRARLLRHKRLYYWRSFGLQAWLGSAEARERVADAWRAGRRLNGWFTTHVG